ncbi:MAG: hypothetical protein ACRDY2_14190 [Acidimicrobiales bacterium]
MPAIGTLPAGDGEHHAGDDEERHHGHQHWAGCSADTAQNVQEVVDHRRGVLAGMEQVAAERTAGHRRGRCGWG